ncbi:HAMP domain-containing histidine kinase [Vibrio sp. T187]|uniref:sensor histidine kinase n=1 Tax=Vibrio TaxID=662 RepID=UPI0010C9F9CE|nr:MULTISPECIES: HAMP domain-containing sensor histidine kinase [Vibrio]MBW3694731.1 HAMP domain-containing histidine kinase [Vibrio sp. T187]
MILNVLSSTRSLTGRLALFFSLVSVIIAGFGYTIFYAALHGSEDRVGERRILLDRNEAIERFKAGESGTIKIDVLTDAYNSVDAVPKKYASHLIGRKTYLGEVGEEPESRMLYLGEYTHNGDIYPIILLSKIDEVEFKIDELVFVSTIVLTLFAILMFSFGALLYRLSQRLIEPFNSLAEQLNSKDIDLGEEFSVSNDAAIEFRQLTEHLNKYRRDINSLVKREQAFARYASHELRTPLTIVKGASKLLVRSEMSDFQSRQVARIDDASTQMSTMVDALLGLVRYERNHDDSPVRLFTGDELYAIVDKNSAQANDKNITLNVHVDSEPTLQATPAIMNMLIGNLIKNAIAATNQGEVTVSLSDQFIDIQDQGEGLLASHNPEGHGLGLLIVDDMCKRYNWSFELSNQTAGGCCARITFEHGEPQASSDEDRMI